MKNKETYNCKPDFSHEGKLPDNSLYDKSLHAKTY